MDTDRDAEPQAGRQIQLVPVGPGVWQVLLGAGVMVMGPLFGFLTGTVLGTDGDILGTNPLFFFLFIGFIVAGVGLGVVLLGVRRIVRHSRRDDAPSSVPTGPAGPTAVIGATGATSPATSERSMGTRRDT